ncbi:hypothetical protein D3875_02940 [Deinococcus cavernae]|uniref:Uncharacterized protein n=1 Tax=Deinococcus cavernae TaxID=2320857 RepID=A0A418VFS5_9DEIO|nr:hypothetical protein [Deinococcus cavernae]RJF74969.1 hypothetical protein D3875_02940 [Deinococcus cavernae]
MPVSLTAKSQAASPTPFDLTIRHSLRESQAFAGPAPWVPYQAVLDDLDASPPGRHELQVILQSLASNLLRVVECDKNLGEHLTLSRIEDALADVRERLRRGGIQA